MAAQGPLWGAGGDRGLYKTTDGGASWNRVLEISENTGVTDLLLDPRDPDVLYAAAYQRRRRVWTLINGGPESGIHKSTDGGATWRELTNGLPEGDLGRIGLAISPVDPDLLYAIVEAAGENGGFFRSTDAGGNWEKRSDYVSSSPQYYQEIVPDPKNPDRVYSLDTWLNVTEDGGKSFHRVPVVTKHVDDHAMWIDPDDTDRLLVGCDGGLYETRDRGESWRFFPNLPITQFYKIAVDNDRPFYNVYGGTQDNFTLGGPARTTSAHGITNDDWYVTVGGDGFQTRVDPEDPNIIYSQSQYGYLSRYDRSSGEAISIRPMVGPGEEPLRFNWDSPLVLSPHDPHRLYFARPEALSQRRPRRQLAPGEPRPDPRPRSQHPRGDGPGVERRRGGQEQLDVLLRHPDGAVRVAAGRRADLRRHRRRPGPGERGRRRELAEDRLLPGRAGDDLCQPPRGLGAR